MHAVVFERNGGPEVLEHREVADPQPTGEQVLVDVEAAGVNFRDVYEREGHGYGSQPPAVIGVEGAGRIDKTGERVAWVDVPRSYAEKVAADPGRLVPVPDGMTSEVAAATLLQGMTAHYLAHDSYPIRKGEWVIVHAAAGGVGLLLTQIVKLIGGFVIATTSTEEKGELARQAGADHVMRYDGFARQARELTAGEGVAAVYDGVGRVTFEEGLTALRPAGFMILFGAASGQPEPLTLARLAPLGSLYVQRPTLATYVRTPQMLRDRARLVFDLVAQSKLSVRIGARYPLREARRSHVDLQARRTTGKAVLLT
jgi:NADPH:quinone reductase